MRKIRSGGFIVLEFAIALPLLILVIYGLAIVSVKVFQLGKIQLADYVLEEEARYVMELITQKARAAKTVETDTNKITIIYHAVDDFTDYYTQIDEHNTAYYFFSDRDVWETQIICPHTKEGRDYPNLYAEHQENVYSNPITGENFFGDTKLNSLKCDIDKDKKKKILRIELEMESLVSGHKIKIATAVFMPSYDGD